MPSDSAGGTATGGTVNQAATSAVAPAIQAVELAAKAATAYQRPDLAARARQALQRLPQPAAAPRHHLFDDGQPGLMRQHQVRPEPAGQLGLGLEPGHHRNRHVRVERSQNCQRAQPQ